MTDGRHTGQADAARADADQAALRDQEIASLHHQLQKASLGDTEGDTPFAACFAALIMALEPTLEIGDLVDSLPRSGRPFGELELVNTLAHIGYTSHRATVRLADLDERLLPCAFLPIPIGLQREDEALVVQAIDRSNGDTVVTLYDGRSKATHVISDDHPLMAIKGGAYFFQKMERPAAHNIADGGDGVQETWLKQTVVRFSRTVILLVIIGLLLNMVALAIPLFIILTYDRVILTGSVEALPMLALGAMSAILMEGILREIRVRTTSWLTGRIDYLVGTDIFSRLVNLPAAYIENASVSSQLARVKTFESARDFFGGALFQSAIELPSVIIAFATIAIIGKWIAIIPAIAVLGYTVLFFVLRACVKPLLRNAAREGSKAHSFTIETLEKLDAIRVSGLEKVWAQKFRDICGREQFAQERLNFVGSIGETLGHSLAVMSAIGTLVLGVNLIWLGSITPGILIACMMLVWRVINPFYSLCAFVPRVEQIRGSLAQIDHLMSLQSEQGSKGVQTRVGTLRGNVGFTNVTLRYTRESAPAVLSLSANFKAGEIVAITGANGTGKSSLLKLILGLYTPQMGTVHIDGYDIRQVMNRDLRRSIAYIPQVPPLIGGTIAQNIRSARPLASDSMIIDAIAKAGGAATLATLPKGVQTHIEDPAVQAAGKLFVHQIAFARVFLHRANLILLDEQPNAILNAGLNTALETLVREARGRQTVFMVSHHPPHMQFADKVIALRHGQAPLVGTIAKTASKPSGVAA